MFRCPCCAVVWKLPLTKNHSLLANQDMNRWTIEREPITLFSKVCEVNTLEETASAFKKLGIDFDLKGGHYIECPSCKVASKYEQWYHAWTFPMDFFDADQLCSCGGELWWDKIEGTAKYALICDKCGWAKPRAILSGHAD